MPDIAAKENVVELFPEAAADALPALLRQRIPRTGSYPLSGRWLKDPYTGLRNAAWAVRNARLASHQNPLALQLVLTEAERLIGAGESLRDVLEAYAELLLRP